MQKKAFKTVFLEKKASKTVFMKVQKQSKIDVFLDPKNSLRIPSLHICKEHLTISLTKYEN
jgi:hypothetical protein